MSRAELLSNSKAKRSPVIQPIMSAEIQRDILIQAQSRTFSTQRCYCTIKLHGRCGLEHGLSDALPAARHFCLKQKLFLIYECSNKRFVTCIP